MQLCTIIRALHSHVGACSVTVVTGVVETSRIRWVALREAGELLPFENTVNRVIGRL